jgi:hypothetical protein
VYKDINSVVEVSKNTSLTQFDIGEHMRPFARFLKKFGLIVAPPLGISFALPRKARS